MSKEVTTCWNCGSANIKPAENIGAGWYQCPDCGATSYDDPVSLGQSEMGTEKDDSTGGRKYRPVKRRGGKSKPSPSPTPTSEVTD